MSNIVSDDPLVHELTAICEALKTTEAKAREKLAADLQAKFDRILKEKLARGAGLFSPAGASTAYATPLLAADQGFKNWLAGARGAKSSYAASFREFKIEQKASPLLNTGGTSHVGAVAGPSRWRFA